MRRPLTFYSNQKFFELLLVHQSHITMKFKLTVTYMHTALGTPPPIQSTEIDVGIFSCVHMINGSNSINEFHSSPSLTPLRLLHYCLESLLYPHYFLACAYQRQERFSLAHGSRGFSSWSVGCMALGARGETEGHGGTHHRGNCSPRGSGGTEKDRKSPGSQQSLQGHAPIT